MDQVLFWVGLAIALALAGGVISSISAPLVWLGAWTAADEVPTMGRAWRASYLAWVASVLMYGVLWALNYGLGGRLDYEEVHEFYQSRGTSFLAYPDVNMMYYILTAVAVFLVHASCYSWLLDYRPGKPMSLARACVVTGIQWMGLFFVLLVLVALSTRASYGQAS